MENKRPERDLIFISKATPGDDAFVIWLAPRLEAAGYTVFADIFDLDGGDDWRRKLTGALQTRAAKMLLCCSDETLARHGVLEEISIAEDLIKQIPDPEFIIPLQVRPFKKVFGISGLQYIDFASGWADGLEKLLKTLERRRVPKTSGGNIQPAWHAYLRRRSVEIESAPEVLTSNWLRVTSMPDTLRYLAPSNRASESQLRKLCERFEYPALQFREGILTFAIPPDLHDSFESFGPFSTQAEIDLEAFCDEGASHLAIEPRDARPTMVNLMRQAWEKKCERDGFLAHQFSGGLSYHVGEDKFGLRKRMPWGRQGQRRNSMLRGIARKKIWEFGVSAVPSLFPYPHLRLKSRVLFSDIGAREKPIIIPDKRKQFRLRRSVCSGWRNRAWHGRVMGFMELMAGESPYVALPVGSNESIVLDAMPIQFTSPVTARQTHNLSEDAEEPDETTLGGHYEDEDV